MGMGVCQELGPVKMVREDKGMDKMGVHRARPWEGEEIDDSSFQVDRPIVLSSPDASALGTHAGLQKECPILSSSSFFGGS